MSRHYREEYTPWSFVVPMALAVMLGVLAADAVRLVVVSIMAKAAIDSFTESVRQQTTPGHLPARPNTPAVEPPEPPIQYGEHSFSDRLPGLLEARRRNLDRACIGGTVSIRESNGWSQDLSTGTPERCVATSQ